MKKRYLIVDNTICSGCMSCVINCSQFHEGHPSPESSRIKVELEPFVGTHRIIYCHQCEDAECAANCPQSAIQYNEEIGAYVIDQELCIQCLTCVDSCLHQAVFEDIITGKVIKCDYCDGDPTCVKSCFTKALWFDTDEENVPDKLSTRYFHHDKKNNENNDE
jgi:Fe-S-cluster-containing hydrogenase component 2